ncbi:MAG: peptide chain release factor 2 [Dehalococcoidia bacterium]|nr:peptide chain release factor 2 [Dehalococcoidia bacterium]
MSEIRDRLLGEKRRISDDMVRLDITSVEKEIAELEQAIVAPAFWDDASAAQGTMRQLAELKKKAGQWRAIEQKAAELEELLLLDEETPGSGIEAEISDELARLVAALDDMEFKLAFASPYDVRNAILAIHAGAGGVDSQDWVSLLLRMYLAWAEKHGYKVEILEKSPGEEAGIKSVTFEITGDYVYGYLKGEHGVHRLIRISPFDSDHARHTSFALAEVMPEVEGNTDIEIRPDDIRVEAYRSSGPGGQNVQKVSSAVRIVHIPSGIVVTSQSERSQHQNKEIAMRILKARLFKIELAKRDEECARLKGKHISAEWGNQIRSYTLHPYHLVKDHRTDFESGNTDAVLGGEIDGFINAYLRFVME